MGRLTASGRWSAIMNDLHINVLELHAIWLDLQIFGDIPSKTPMLPSCVNHYLSKKSGGHSVSKDMPHGHRYLRMGRRRSMTSQCVSRSYEPERSLWPLRALRYYLSRTNISDPNRSKRVFVSIKPGLKKDIVKGTLSCWIKGIIRSAYSDAQNEDLPHLTSQNVQASELRAMATSLGFHLHHSLKQVMEASAGV